MDAEADKPTWSLPFSSPLPDSPRRRITVTAGRIAVCVLICAALIGTSIQYQVLFNRNIRRAEELAKAHPDGLPRKVKAVKAHKGAMGRWRMAVRRLWAGENIYKTALAVTEAEKTYKKKQRLIDDPRAIGLHPNTPFTVILMTPFAYMPPGVMAICWNMLKFLAVVAAALMAARLANHRRQRMPDWVLALGVLWALILIVTDIQHANTNIFALGAIALHLWLYRRGRVWAAGAALALAICLKMTPALFLLYWLYQRNWKLLAATATAGVVMVVVVPAALLGPSHGYFLTHQWLDNIILPAAVESRWFPIHINQSLSGVVSRYLLAGKEGNIFWNPSDNPLGTNLPPGHINFVALSPATARIILHIGQVAIVALMAWAIGWRKLPRDDGRRSLHYAMVIIAMLLLNQRAWRHHAAILLIADVAIWYAVAFGRFSRKLRGAALGLVLASGPLLWLFGTDGFKALAMMQGLSSEVGGRWADFAEAYGPTFCHFVLLFAAAVMMSLAMKRNETPYAQQRQKLFKSS